MSIHNAEAMLANVESWHDPVVATLRSLGFFELFGFNDMVDRPDLSSPLQILPMRSGRTADSVAVNSLIDGLKGLYPEGDAGSGASLLHLYGAMIEAVVNVVRHAYPTDGSYVYQPVGRWWMGGAVDREARWTTAMVFDQGVTIPISLPNWHHYGGVLRRLAARAAQGVGIAPAPGDPKSDGQAIAAAVDESVSSTGSSHRGRGLAQMRDFVDQCQEGYLRIMSRFGEVVFRPGLRPDVRSHGTSIGGTLIEWNVLLKAEAEE